MHRNLIQWLKHNAGLLVLLVAVIAVYAHALSGELVVDDLFIVKDNPFLDGSQIAHFFSHGFWESTADKGNAAAIYRPLVLVYFRLMHALSGVEPFGYHVSLLLLHLADTFLVYVTARRLLAASAFAATLGAAVFALHPLGVESVAWISGVPDPLAAFFLLLALLAHHAFVGGQKEWLYLLMAAGCFQLALWSKEVAIAFPVVVLIYDLAVVKKPNRISTALYFGLAISYLIVRGLVLGKDGGWASINLGQFPRALDLASGYAELLIFPTQVPFYLQPPRHPISSAVGWCAAVLMVCVIAISWLKFDSGRRKLLLFSVAWMAAFSWTAMLMMFYLRGYYSARFLYVPLIGMAFFVALLAGWIGENRSGLRISAAVLCIMLIAAGSVVTAREIPSWHDEETIYSKVIELAPDDSAGFQNLGFYYAMHNDPAKGEYYLRQAVRIDPENSPAWTGLGNLAWMGGQMVKAIPLYLKALSIQPGNYEAAMNLASVYEQTGQAERAAAIRNTMRSRGLAGQ